MSKKLLFISLLALIALAACGGATAEQSQDAAVLDDPNVVTVYKSPT